MAKLFGLKTDLWEKMNVQAAVKCTEWQLVLKPQLDVYKIHLSIFYHSPHAPRLRSTSLSYNLFGFPMFGFHFHLNIIFFSV